MSCSNRINQHFGNLDVVRTLAQNTANLTGIEQIIYKHICYGKIIFKFSDYWPGESIEIVRPNRENTSTGVLSNNELGGFKPTESIEPKAAKKNITK